MRNSLRTGLEARLQNLKFLRVRLHKPEHLLLNATERVANESWQLSRAFVAIHKDRKRSLDQAVALLESYSYERILDRGFALISNTEGNTVSSVKKLKTGDKVGLRFGDGEALALIAEPSETGKSRLSSSNRVKRKTGLSGKSQGQLL